MKKNIQYILFAIFLTFFSISYAEAKACVYSSQSNNISINCSTNGKSVSCTSENIEIKDISNLKVETINSCNPITVIMEYSVIYSKLPTYIYSDIPSPSNYPAINQGELKLEVFTGVTEEENETNKDSKEKLTKFNGTSCIYTGMGLRYVCTIKDGSPECVLGTAEGSTPTGNMHWDPSKLINNLTSSDFMDGENFVCPYVENDSNKTISVCGTKTDVNYYTANWDIVSIGKSCSGYSNIFNLAYSPYSKDFDGNEGYNEETKENLIINPGFESNIKIDFDTQKGCESYLGNPHPNPGEPKAPAYYLQFAFNLIKYAAIILLLVLTIVDYAKAVASSNQDAMKKATINAVKRIIIAAVVFMLPILIEFLFKLLGLYSSTTCGIN